MRRRSCVGLAELRSAFVDDALGGADRDRLLSHLASCPQCRAELNDFRQIRRILRTGGPSARAPRSLSTRLVSIAGGRAAEPVPATAGSGPPRPAGRHPWRRTSRALALAGTAVVAVGTVGYAAAPPAPAAILDPTSGAAAEYRASVAEMPLLTDAAQALLRTEPTDLLDASAGSTAVRPPAGDRAQPLDQAAAARLLQRAASAAATVSYTGVQTVRAERAGEDVSATVRVTARAGEARFTRLLGADQRRIGADLVTPTVATRFNDSDVVARIANRWVLSGWTGATVAGRSAHLVEARHSSAPAGSRPAARWWLDTGTGLLLGQEAYDPTGAPTLTAGFTSVRIGRQPEVAAHLPPRPSPPATTASLTLGQRGTLQRSGWVCAAEVSGLDLVRLRTDHPDNPDMLHLVYTDGVTTLSLIEQRGRLAAAPAGSTWNPQLGAWVREGTPTVASWQSGPVVLTVATDAQADRLAAVLGALPHDPPGDRTTMERVRAGWARILDALMG